MTTLSYLSVIVVLFLSVKKVDGGDIYVAPSTSFTGDGSSANPYPRINDALDEAGGGFFFLLLSFTLLRRNDGKLNIQSHLTLF